MQEQEFLKTTFGPGWIFIFEDPSNGKYVIHRGDVVKKIEFYGVGDEKEYEKYATDEALLLALYLVKVRHFKGEFRSVVSSAPDLAASGSAYGGYTVINMPFFRGVDLECALFVKSLQLQCELLLGVYGELVAMHLQGIIHRDVKPENVLIPVGADDTRTPTIIDFGCAIMEGNIPVACLDGNIVEGDERTYPRKYRPRTYGCWHVHPSALGLTMPTPGKWVLTDDAEYTPSGLDDWYALLVSICKQRHFPIIHEQLIKSMSSILDELDEILSERDPFKIKIVSATYQEIISQIENVLNELIAREDSSKDFGAFDFLDLSEVVTLSVQHPALFGGVHPDPDADSDDEVIAHAVPACADTEPDAEVRKCCCLRYC